MEVDLLMLCTSDQQQHSDEDILATIKGELIDDQTMSELATAERPTFDESRTDGGEVCQCNDTVTSLNEIMLTTDGNQSGGVAPTTDNGPLKDEFAGFSNVCVLPATLSHTTRSDIVESQEEETSAYGAPVNRRNFNDCTVDAHLDDSVSAVDCVVGNALYNVCDPSAPANDVYKTTCSVTENYDHHTETMCDTQSPEGGSSETSSVSCAESISSDSVIAVVDTSNVISDIDSTLIVNVPDTESDGNVTTSCCTDAVSADNTQLTNGLSDEKGRLELAEAIDIEAKKKGFRVRFHESHVTGYLDPPTPWREGWHHIPFLHTTLPCR